MKSIVQSQSAGNMLVLPREGGYLVRLYVELDRLHETERVADRGLGIADIIARAGRILRPYHLDVKEVVWWSIYEIGHRLSDKFDDVPPGAAATRGPRVFIAGDACHTHSPKAGQGMNVSMGDTFNLGWKLISVLTGRAPTSLLHSYAQERRAAAQALIDFDHEWSRVIGAPPEGGTAAADVPRVQRQFMAGARFTAGLTVRYAPSIVIGPGDWQQLATGLVIGERFHSAPVVRLADGRPMQLGHVIEAGIRWTVFAFAPEDPAPIHALCRYLAEDPDSPLRRFRRAGEDIDALIDLRAVFRQGFRELAFEALPPLLRPAKGRYGLTDYEKAFCVDHKRGPDIYRARGIDRERGCMVIVRPDQHVAHILPLEAHDELARFFDGIFLPAPAG